MIAHVYRSERKQDTYLYLRELDAFSLAPEAIVKTLQPLNFSFSFELTPDRKLARGDAAIVFANLRSIGYHIQFPPREDLGHTED